MHPKMSGAPVNQPHQRIAASGTLFDRMFSGKICGLTVNLTETENSPA